MIIDVRKFVDAERGYWEELEQILARQERDPYGRMEMVELARFHYLYERVSADLARIATFAAERETRTYLETLVARAYGEIHETREKPHRFRPLHWFVCTFPRTFRRHSRAFQLVTAVTLLGALFAVAAVKLDPGAKYMLLPAGFEHLMRHPSDRVADEEEAVRDRLAGERSQFAAFLMTHNIRVCLVQFGLGLTWGIGTILYVFWHGVILGVVAIDYVLAGETAFLVGWLLPHGSVEIPAVLLSGQAGLVLAGALIGRRTRKPLRARLRDVTGDLVTLVAGIALLLAWAGVIESFFSQYHEPVLPYWVKITFGSVELVALVLFLTLAGRKAPPGPADTGRESAGAT
ncbi:MAG: stage II sporulation protein M [Kiritimatiellae bacterium]|nr:stage II sporulation protein M [Kiritimatiellia bacterium]